MVVGFIVVAAAVIGYQFSSHSIEQSKATKQVKAEITAMEAAYQQKLTPNEKHFQECISINSALLANAHKYGNQSEVSRRKSYLRDCDVFLR